MIMPPLFRRFIPAAFVLIWSSGFIITRYSMPYAEPLTFLSIRFAGVLAVMLPFLLLVRAQWPDRGQALHLAAAGVLLQAGYLGGVWAAAREGLSVGLIALIVGLQPILTALAAAALSERVTARQWLGLVCGISGVGLVVLAKLSLTGLTPLGFGLALTGLASITLGTIYQKRFCPSFDLRTGSVIQFSAALAVVLPLSFLLETREIIWHPQLVGAMVWAILPLSIGAISLLFIMIRDGAATQVTSVLYLTPPTTALMAWVLFDEPITILTILGTLLTVFGVWWVSRHQAVIDPRPSGQST